MGFGECRRNIDEGRADPDSMAAAAGSRVADLFSGVPAISRSAGDAGLLDWLANSNFRSECLDRFLRLVCSEDDQHGRNAGFDVDRLDSARSA